MKLLAIFPLFKKTHTYGHAAWLFYCILIPFLYTPIKILLITSVLFFEKYIYACSVSCIFMWSYVTPFRLACQHIFCKNFRFHKVPAKFYKMTRNILRTNAYIFGLFCLRFIHTLEEETQYLVDVLNWW